MGDTTGNGKPRRRSKQKCGQVRILPIEQIRPSPENTKLYGFTDPDDPEVRALTLSIKANGIQEPLVVTKDGWIVSGHRRHTAAMLANLRKLPVRVLSVRRDQMSADRFVVLLRENNRQRIKTLSQKLREEVVSADPEEAYQALIEHREEAAVVDVETIAIRGKKRRSKISKAKFPFLNAVIKILNDNRKFVPFTVRQIHYYLLNDPPLKHANKPDSTYCNTVQSYKSLDELLVRARLEGRIPWECIADETRPMIVWNVHADPQTFIRQEMGGLFKGYWRDLMQSQPHHIEIIGEKNTISSIIRPIAMRYCIPMTLGRGYCSLPPRHAMAERFRKSGKDRLVILALSDFDPDGEEIAHSFAKSMRDDFGIGKITPVKVALTAAQVDEYDLPPIMTAKQSGSVSRRARFVEQYGEVVHELEALQPDDLQTILTAAIDSVIDIEAFNHEIDQEKADAAFLDGVRRTVHEVLQEIDFDTEAPDA